MTDGPEDVRVPPVPGALLDPRPVVLVGTLAWAVALVAVLAAGGGTRAAVLCAVGLGVGALGYLVYVLQRRAVLRGSAGAQRGLDFDRD